MDSKTEILFARYFSGEVTGEELRDLENYLAESTEHEAYFNEMTKLYEQTAMISSMPRPNVEKATADFKKYIHKDETVVLSPRRHLFFSRYAAVAAVVIIIVGLLSLFLINEKPDAVNILADAEDVRAVTLFDQVEVNLEHGSKLSYQKESPNEPELIGKAIFAVKQKTSKQLIIKAGNTYIRDIGTVFSVDATSPSDSVTVEVTEGEVMFYTKNNQGISLKKGQAGAYYPQKDMFKYKTDIQDNGLAFDNMSLPEIIPQLESKYDVIIHLQSESLEQLHINVNFAKGESIDEILKIITETLSLRMEKNDKGEYILSEK
ncbi:MAG: DUF4974 domain-containing protein [Paludibacter sp.]|nr:DUF4974 domain-containing protein [Paludibacter sp.]